ncbi:MAG: PHP domain-containing protein [Chitinivibrionales bacterium]|nr:PHP domain-containing protein [Chitinivibrionales bacterium]
MGSTQPLNVNTHIHTPYSFSAFSSVEEAIASAKDEDVRVLGISDFNTIEGHAEFSRECTRASIYPLFNIEFIAFSQEDKDNNRRWNDPKNPGVMYFCGKALNFPPSMSKDSRNELKSLWKGTQDHIWEVIARLSDYLEEALPEIDIDYIEVRNAFAKNTVRERHVAKALYHAIEQAFTPPDRLCAYRRLFREDTFEADIFNEVAMQDHLRSRLLKAGKPAYVAEKNEAFLNVKKVMHIVLDAGGIPCYPVLADESAGLNECEKDVVALADALIRRRVFCVEFIPLRNGFDHLKSYVKHFLDRGFCVLFGTEHNTPQKIPVLPAARNGQPFDEELRRIAWEGACILAAHQERHNSKGNGFVDAKGNKLVDENKREEFVSYGNEMIRTKINPGASR